MSPYTLTHKPKSTFQYKPCHAKARTNTRTFSISQTFSATQSPTITPIITPTTTSTDTQTSSYTSTSSQTHSTTNSISQSSSQTHSVTKSISQSSTTTSTITPSHSPSITQTHSTTNSISQSSTTTSTITPSHSSSNSTSSTSSITQTHSPTNPISQSSTQTRSPTNSISQSSTQTHSTTNSISQTSIQTPTITQSPTPILTPIPTETKTPLPTDTPISTYTPSFRTEKTFYYRQGQAQFWLGKSPNVDYTGFYVTSAGIKTGPSIMSHDINDDANAFYDYAVFTMRVISLVISISSPQITQSINNVDLCTGFYNCPPGLINTDTVFTHKPILTISPDTTFQSSNSSYVYNSNTGTYNLTMTYLYSDEIESRSKFNMFFMVYPDSFQTQDVIADLNYTMQAWYEYYIPDKLR